jgi:methionyl-tRNA synthetase
MLMAHEDYVLPENVPANEFLNLEGNKLSTSRNYAVWLDDYLKTFPPDNLRYVLASLIPETKDSDFSWKDFQNRSNFELADILGNFIHRTLTFTEKYFDNRIPSPGIFDKLDQQACNILAKTPIELGNCLEKFEIRGAVRSMMDLARFANKYFNDQEPWKTRTDNIEKCATTLYLCLELTCSLAIAMSPFLPFTARHIWNIMKLDGDVEEQHWDKIGELFLNPGQKLNKAHVLFPKIEDVTIEEEINKLKQIAIESNFEAQESIKNKGLEEKEQKMELITFDDFKKLDLRVAKVLSAAPVEKTDKLMRIQIDLGTEKRQIVAGIAKAYKPEDLVGKSIAVVANLQPAVIRGVESNGMLLAASKADEVVVLTLDKDIEPGSIIK